MIKQPIKIWSIFVALLVLTLSSCKDKEVAPDFIKLETSTGTALPDILSIEAEGSTQSIRLQSNGSWKINPTGKNSSWLAIHPDHGNDNGSISITAEPNTHEAKREVDLSFTLNGKQLTVLKIEQKGTGPSLKVTPLTPDALTDAGGEVAFTINTSADWKYTITDGDWLTEKSRTSNSLTLKATENTVNSQRKAKVLFSLTSFDQVTEEVEIVQNGITEAPVAELLNLIFKADGTAEDISPFKNSVSTVEGIAMSTVYSKTYKRYLARFNHSPGVNDMTTGFYKIDYSSNQNFKNALADGHALEAVFRLDIDQPLPNAEIKILSSHQAGGTGLMLGNSSKGNAITFLPHVGSGWTWTNSDIIPERGKFYHVIGVWNKQEGKSSIYVNGELKATVNTSGNFNFPSASANWFGVGVDPRNASTAEMGLKGDIAIARIYNKALTAAEVGKLWTQVEDFKPSSGDVKINKISLPSKRVLVSANYTIKGEGFISGDKILMKPLIGAGNEYSVNSTVAGNTLSFKIPTNFETGRYRFFVVRGGSETDIGFATLTVADQALTFPEVIAHRGYWVTGASQNSISALQRAQELGIYGSEFDVRLTLDGVAVINHDPTIQGIRIESVNHDQLKDIRLSNGEKLPTLEEYLIQGKKDPSTKMILEIKTHLYSTNGKSNNDRAVEEVINRVNTMNMADQVEYIAFSIDVCKKILEVQPSATVAYLNGDLPPQSVHALGIKGIDYNLSALRKNKDWITQAKNLGMTVNVWTVNSESDLREVITAGVDFITTDQPVLANQLIEDY